MRGICFLLSIICQLYAFSSINFDSLLQVNSVHTKADKMEFYYISVVKYDSIRSKEGKLDQFEILKKLATDIAVDTVTSDFNLIHAVYLTEKGLYDSSVVIYNENIELLQSLNDSSELMRNYLGAGINYGKLGFYEKAIDFFIKSLKLAEALNNIKMQASAFNNIGIVENKMKNHDKAISYYEKSIKIKEELKDTMSLVYDYQNISGVYYNQKKHTKSLEYGFKTLELTESINDIFGIGLAQIGIGLNYIELGEFQKAYTYISKGDSINQILKHPWFSVNVLSAYGSIHSANANYLKAIEMYKECSTMAEEYKMIEELKNSYSGLAEAYEKSGDLENAIFYFKLFETVKDSIYDSDKMEQMAQLESKYQSEKKDAEIKLLNVNKSLNEAKIKKQAIINYAVIGGAILIVLFSIILYNRLQLTKKQKEIIAETNEELNQTNEELSAQRDEIENQKNKIETAHQEIRSSIDYAKRIQEAILPSMEEMNRNLKDGFVIYQPKDVVAGDFYWQESVNNKVLVAAADCTGHGIPGAMVSVVCSNALTKAVLEDGITDVGKILDRTREIVIKKLAKSGDVKDGMDISLACFDFENMKLEWAGANNPLYLLRDNEIHITKGDREPIGYTENSTPFTTHKINIKTEDQIYLFTDGYADQFGGEESKKMGHKKFREKLLQISKSQMNEQKVQLKNYFNQWQGSEEQVDDVCIIGIRIANG